MSLILTYTDNKAEFFRYLKKLREDWKFKTVKNTNEKTKPFGGAR